jgi:hypothetical protein
MKQIYIVIKGGCVLFISSDDQHVIKNVGVTLIDLDDQEDPGYEPEDIETAESLTRIW